MAEKRGASGVGSPKTRCKAPRNSKSTGKSKTGPVDGNAGSLEGDAYRQRQDRVASLSEVTLRAREKVPQEEREVSEGPCDEQQDEYDDAQRQDDEMAPSTQDLAEHLPRNRDLFPCSDTVAMTYDNLGGNIPPPTTSCSLQAGPGPTLAPRQAASSHVTDAVNGSAGQVELTFSQTWSQNDPEVRAAVALLTSVGMRVEGNGARVDMHDPIGGVPVPPSKHGICHSDPHRWRHHPPLSTPRSAPSGRAPS